MTTPTAPPRDGLPAMITYLARVLKTPTIGAPDGPFTTEAEARHSLLTRHTHTDPRLTAA